MTPTQDIGLPLLLEIDPLSPLEASLAGVLGASVAFLFAEPQGAKRPAKDEEEGNEEEEEEEEGPGPARKRGEASTKRMRTTPASTMMTKKTRTRKKTR